MAVRIKIGILIQIIKIKSDCTAKINNQSFIKLNHSMLRRNFAYALALMAAIAKAVAIRDD